MIDYNDEEYLNKLREASNSDDGKIIVEYLKHEMNLYDYEDIGDGDMEEVGMKFMVLKATKKYFKEVLSKLDGIAD